MIKVSSIISWIFVLLIYVILFVIFMNQRAEFDSIDQNSDLTLIYRAKTAKDPFIAYLYETKKIFDLSSEYKGLFYG